VLKKVPLRRQPSPSSQCDRHSYCHYSLHQEVVSADEIITSQIVVTMLLLLSLSLEEEKSSVCTGVREIQTVIRMNKCGRWLFLLSEEEEFRNVIKKMGVFLRLRETNKRLRIFFVFGLEYMTCL